MLEVEPKTIFLEGLSLLGRFKLHNNDNAFGYTYKISSQSSTFSSEDENVSIFPHKGFLLPNTTEIIKIKPKLKSYLTDRFKIKILYSASNNYNSIKAKNRQIPSTYDMDDKTIDVEVQIGTQHTRIKKELDDEVQFSSILGKDSSNISIIKEKAEKSIDDGKSIVAELQISSNHKEQQKYPQFLTSSIRRPEFTLKKIEQKKVDSFQIIILAIIAAFFFALGSNAGKFFS